LERLVRTRVDTRLASIDWFVVGRIAEHLGLPHEARKAYEKIETPTDPGPTSTYELAKKRIVNLGKH
jgi:hypothetical protein